MINLGESFPLNHSDQIQSSNAWQKDNNLRLTSIFIIKGKILISFQGQPAEEIVDDIDRSTLILSNIDAHYAGVFQCLDDDGSEKPKHGMFNILVNYIPKVTTHRHHINTQIGSNAELYCDYKSEPIAVTRWLKNGHPLSYSEKYMISYAKDKHSNRTTLIVNDVEDTDLGEYICQAEVTLNSNTHVLSLLFTFCVLFFSMAYNLQNALGTSELKTHLMLEPEKGQFEDIKIFGNKVILNWIVRSLQPLSEAVLDYKLKGVSLCFTSLCKQ